MEKRKILKSIIEKLHRGATVSEVKEEFKEVFGTVSASEIAEAENELVRSGMPVEEIQKLCDVHATLFEGHVEKAPDDFPAGHPLMVFKEENKGLRRFLDQEFDPVWKRYRKSPSEGKSAMLWVLGTLGKIDRHYARKENLFFPYLERAGISAPPKVMWGVDDEIRQLIRKSVTSVENDLPESAETTVPETVNKVRDMITKEEEILLPMLIHNMGDEEWRTVATESPQFGYAFTGDREGASPSDAAVWAKRGSADPVRHGNDPIQLPSGHFTPSELAAMLNSLPCDITFVGNDDKVHYFSETRERIFPRTRTIIGRNVADCHPPKSLDIVQKLVEAFRSGTKDHEHFWIQRGERFILIRYFAVRDESGSYLGVVELTEDIGPLRKLEGEKTLMS